MERIKMAGIFSVQGMLVRFLLCMTALVTPQCSERPVVNPGTPQPPVQPSIFDWTVQSTFTVADLHDIFFVSSSGGWAVGDSQVILSTSNGGQTWPVPPIGSLERDLRGVFLISSGRGWIAGGQDGDEPDGYLFLSVNGGAYAEPQLRVDGPLNTVFFLDDVTGWCGGSDGTILSTSDGMSWSVGTLGEPVTILDLHFVSPVLGWAATSGGLYLTEDGTAWNKVNIDPPAALRSVFFLDKQHGWACGEGNQVLIGEPGAGNEIEWKATGIPGEETTTWSDIFFVDSNAGWIVGSAGNVCKTIDGGRNWVPEITGTSLNLNAVHMLSRTRGWIAGNEGTILTYTPK
jgi:photosystem II stability/assembly factor-like uncharacterized protein